MARERSVAFIRRIKVHDPILLVARNKRNKEAEIWCTDYGQFLFVKVYSASAIGKPAPITPGNPSSAWFTA
jgi:hypothetical protein